MEENDTIRAVEAADRIVNTITVIIKQLVPRFAAPIPNPPVIINNIPQMKPVLVTAISESLARSMIWARMTITPSIICVMPNPRLARAAQCLRSPLATYGDCNGTSGGVT